MPQMCLFSIAPNAGQMPSSVTTYFTSSSAIDALYIPTYETYIDCYVINNGLIVKGVVVFRTDGYIRIYNGNGTLGNFTDTYPSPVNTGWYTICGSYNIN